MRTPNAITVGVAAMSYGFMAGSRRLMGAGGEAKFWLQPVIALADSAGMDAKTLRRLLMLVQDNRASIERAWHDHFA